MCRLAKLTENELKNVRDCEKRLDLVLVAYEKCPKLAELTDEQLTRIRDVENQLGLRLVAYT